MTPEEAPELHGIVDRLCALADMPKPRVAIARSPMPNAFATGRNAKKAVLCVTTSLMDGRALTAKELAYTAHVTPQTASGSPGTRCGASVGSTSSSILLAASQSMVLQMN